MIVTQMSLWEHLPSSTPQYYRWHTTCSEIHMRSNWIRAVRRKKVCKGVCTSFTLQPSTTTKQKSSDKKTPNNPTPMHKVSPNPFSLEIASDFFQKPPFPGHWVPTTVTKDIRAPKVHRIRSGLSKQRQENSIPSALPIAPQTQHIEKECIIKEDLSARHYLPTPAVSNVGGDNLGQWIIH